MGAFSEGLDWQRVGGEGDEGGCKHPNPSDHDASCHDRENGYTTVGLHLRSCIRPSAIGHQPSGQSSPCVRT
jgi:hypothetical protein